MLKRIFLILIIFLMSMSFTYGTLAFTSVPLNSVSAIGPIYHTDRSAFEAAYPDLPLEEFEDGSVADGEYMECEAPLSITTTGGSCFAVGDIMTGLLFQDDEGPDDIGLLLIGSGFNNNPDNSLLANTRIDSFDIIFTAKTNVAGMDLQSHFDEGNVLLTIYAADKSTILATTTASATNGGAFWGVTASEHIGRINILSISGQAEGIDNIAIGSTFRLFLPVFLN